MVSTANATNKDKDGKLYYLALPMHQTLHQTPSLGVASDVTTSPPCPRQGSEITHICRIGRNGRQHPLRPQNPPPLRAYEFKSRLRHQRSCSGFAQSVIAAMVRVPDFAKSSWRVGCVTKGARLSPPDMSLYDRLVAPTMTRDPGNLPTAPDFDPARKKMRTDISPCTISAFSPRAPTRSLSACPALARHS
jgi:hypothetical protein